MITVLTIVAILIGALAYVTGAVPQVTELPWGLEEPLSIFMNQINTLITVFPPLEVIWQVFIIALTVKIAVISFEIAWRVITLIRGGG